MFHGSLLNIMGTRFDIILIGKAKIISEQIWNEIVDELQRLDKIFNRFDSESDLFYLNLWAIKSSVQVTAEFWGILLDCRNYFQKTFGLFDITLKDFSQISFNEQKREISFCDPEISLDFGAYAKGYAVETINTMLIKSDVQQAFIDFGSSSILAIGNQPYGDSWSVSIENPFVKGVILEEFNLRNCAMSTSGNMPTHSKHIIHPKSQQYSDVHKLVCVRAKNSIEAEVLSTALMIADNSETERIKENFKDVDINIYNL